MDKSLYNNRINQLNGVLVVVTLIACALCTYHVSHLKVRMGFNFSFLIWNLFLCWVPYILSFILYRRCVINKSKGVLDLIIGLVWLLFYPNAIYILTDSLHFRLLEDVFISGGVVGSTTIDPALWFSFSVLSLFIVLGFVLSMVSLYFVQLVISRRYKAIAGWAFSLGVVFISTYGIYLGRVFRFNSWDIVSRPLFLLSGMMKSLNVNTLIFMVILTLMYYPLYMVFYALIGTYKNRY